MKKQLIILSIAGVTLFYAFNVLTNPEKFNGPINMVGPVHKSITEEDLKSFDINKIFQKENVIPIVILGSGPAGLTAGMYGTRSGLYTVVFAGFQPGGQLTETSYVENWPGVKKKLGFEIMDTLREQAEEFGTTVIDDAIESVDFNTWPFELKTASGELINALSVIIATGSSHRKLGVPGELEYFGRGVTACAVCDCLFFKNKDVVIVGGGDSAVEEAMQLSVYANNVTILVRGSRMRAAKRMQDKLHDYENVKIIYNKQILQVLGDGKSVIGVEVKDLETNETSIINTDGLFTAIGQNPNTDLFAGKLELNNLGYIHLDSRSQMASVKGVYAAGDVEDAMFRQAVVSAAHGCQAGLEAIGWLRDIGLSDLMAKKLKHKYFKKTN